MFGKVTAAFSVTEVQGRGALHAHCAIWGTSLTPDFLLKVSPCPLLVDEVAKVLDSMFVAVMPDEVHLQYLIGRVEKIKFHVKFILHHNLHRTQTAYFFGRYFTMFTSDHEYRSSSFSSKDLS